MLPVFTAGFVGKDRDVTQALISPQEWADEERKTEQRSDEDNARAEADAQRTEQVEDQEGPHLGDLGSLEE
jgi:hypothetical protein